MWSREDTQQQCITAATRRALDMRCQVCLLATTHLAPCNRRATTPSSLLPPLSYSFIPLLKEETLRNIRRFRRDCSRISLERPNASSSRSPLYKHETQAMETHGERERDGILRIANALAHYLSGSHSCMGFLSLLSLSSLLPARSLDRRGDAYGDSGRDYLRRSLD